MSSKQFFPELEGIRGYAFIVVFLVHFMAPSGPGPSGPGLIRYLWFLFVQIAWVAVPIFFVLSGFLITGILFDSRRRKGYFSVFYRRRAIRILPLYYLTLALFAGLSLLAHFPLVRGQFWFLIYAENLYQTPAEVFSNSAFTLGHLWSLAVEEQFYIVWPLVVWLFPDRKQLLRVCYGVIAASCLLRALWPFVGLPMISAYSSTFARVDGILLGALLALHSRAQGFHIHSIRKVGYAGIVVALAAVYGRVLVHGNAVPDDLFGVAVLIPAINLLAAGIVILCLTPGSHVQRLCRVPWACSLGSMSYSLYLMHHIANPWIQSKAAPWLSYRLGHPLSRLVIVIATAGVTYVAARITYRHLELPGMRAKERYRYGPDLGSTRRSHLFRPRPGLHLYPVRTDRTAQTPERTYAAATHLSGMDQPAAAPIPPQLEGEVA